MLSDVQGRGHAFVIAFLVNLPFGVVAQQLEPSSYSNIPLGMNFVVASYGYSEGSITTDAASPVNKVTPGASSNGKQPNAFEIPVLISPTTGCRLYTAK